MLGVFLLIVGQAARAAPELPNIVVIYADDLGYGDVSCQGGRIPTPHIDQLAQEGLRFTDAHSSAATCTPSRYALLTGDYAWRRDDTGIATGDAPLLLDTSRPTLPSILRSAGYTTGIVGKWHLGLGDGGLDWNAEIKPGPLELGFDYAFLVPATGDRVPSVYVENHHVLNLHPEDPIRVSYLDPVGDDPTGSQHPEYLRQQSSTAHDQTIVNAIGRLGYMTGGNSARWVDEDIGATLTRRAVDWMRRAGDLPFFLIFSTHDIHVPRAPGGWFRGTTGFGLRGDAIAQLDWSVGKIMEALKEQGAGENTLVIFTSDNGPVVDDGYLDGSVEGLGDHHPAGPWRGGKYSAFEGGTRVPWFVWWPKKVSAGESSALVCQVDFLASFAALAGKEKPSNAGRDSANLLAALLGESAIGRDELVEEALTATTGALALRSGNWKYITPCDGPAYRPVKDIETGYSSEPQLYDLSRDPGERQNLASKFPDRVEKMAARLEELRRAGRSQ